MLQLAKKDTRSAGSYVDDSGPIITKLDFDSIQDKIWFNTEIRPSLYLPSNTTPAIYTQQFTQNIVDNPGEYYCVVPRFSVPTGLIPAFIPEFANINTGETVYSVTLEYNGNIFQQPIYFTAVNNLPKTDPAYAFIYSYDDFVYMINNALNTAFGFVLPPAGALAPYFKYSDGRFSFICQRAYYDVGLALPIKVFMNSNLNTLMNGLTTYNGNNTQGRDYLINVRDFKYNWYNPSNLVASTPPDYYIFTQNYDNMAAWNILKSLRLVSNSLPVKKEFISNTGVLSGVGVLQDFIPIYTSTEIKPAIVQYVASQYHLINLTGHVPINKLDFKFVWVDSFGVEHPLIIPNNSVCSIQIAFFKKSTYTS